MSLSFRDHDQARAHVAGVVHRLIGHAGTHRAIADHRDHVEIITPEITRGRHPQPRRDRGRTVGGAERVILALGTFREPGQPSRLANGSDTVTAPGQDLVRIALVADIPEHFVIGCVEHVMQRHGKLDHAKTGAEMTAGHRDGVDGLGTQFVRHLLKTVGRQTPETGNVTDPVEQWGFNHQRQSISFWRMSSPGSARPINMTAR